MSFKNNKLITAVKVVAGALVVGLALNISTLVSYAESAGKITGDTVNVRAEASTTSAALGTKSKNETVTILAQTTGADGYIWYQIQFNATTVGYVRSDFATVTDGSTPDTLGAEGSKVDESITYVNPVSGTVAGGQAVRVRQDASTSSSIVSSAASGTSLTVNGKKEGTDGRLWYYVEYVSEGATCKGFIRSDFIELSGDLVEISSGDGEIETPDAPVDTDPADTTPAPASQPYEVQLQGDAWFLLDYSANKQYSITELLASLDEYQSKYEKQRSTSRALRVWMIIFIVISIAAIGGCAFLFLKLRDMGDQSAMAEAEKERKARLANGSQKPSRPAGPNGQRPVGPNGQRPAGPNGQRPVGPNGQRPVGPNGQRPVGPSGQRPAGTVPTQRPAGTVPTQRPAGAAPVQRPVQSAQPTQSAPQPAPKKVDEEDEFEFGFLNWDDEEKK